MNDSIHELAWHVDWDDRFRTDIPAIDAEHRAFVDLVNEMNARIQSGESCAEVRPIVKALIRDTVTHFEHEERLFQQWQYSGRGRHARMHSAILDRLAQLTRQLVEETPVSVRREIGLTIRDLLIDHIRNEDREFNLPDEEERI